MFQLSRFGIKPGLDTIYRLLVLLGSPHTKYHIVHVAGTNGKGSVCAYLSSIMKQVGFRVGVYTSPHLVKFNERICINDNYISDQEVVDSYEKIFSYARHLVDIGHRHPTFFEITTAMALDYFAHKQVDWVILETGMGGRLDATNIVNPDICIITNVSREHCQYLGNTIKEITIEKAGIIKRKVPIITSVTQESAIKEIHIAAKKCNAPLYSYGQEFSARKLPCTDQNNNQISYKGIFRSFSKLLNPLPGDHQKKNLSLGLAAWEIICHEKASEDKRYSFDITQVSKGISQTRWPGRLEIIQKNPLVILDGAHNLDAVSKLRKYIEKYLKDTSLTLVLGILDDKPYDAMMSQLLPLTSKLILTSPRISRSLDTKILKKCAQNYFSGAILEIQDPAAAASHAICQAKPNEAVCIAGSLYVVGEVKKSFLDKY